MKHLNLWAAVGAFAFTVFVNSAPASAAVTFIGATRPCSITDIAGATACAGYYEGNGIAGTSDKVDNRLDAFTRLGLSGTPTIVDSVDATSTSGVIDFGQLLYGRTVISAHWGAGRGGPGVGVRGGVSGLYVFNFAAPTASVTTIFGGTWSNARLFSTETPCTGGPRCGGTGGGVPEPATWAMMIIGFSGVGAMIRRRRMLPA